MSRPFSLREKWPHAVTAALFLLVGIDVGLRLAARGGPTAPAATPAAAPQGNTAPPAQTTIVVVRPGARGSDSDPDPGHADPPPPDPVREASKQLAEKWAKGPDAGPMYATREAEPPMPRAEGKFAELLRAAEETASKGDKKGALKLYEEAEGAAADPRHKEDMRLRRLWIFFELGDAKEVRRLAEAIGAHPVRAESRRVAGEVIAKLDSKK